MHFPRFVGHNEALAALQTNAEQQRLAFDLLESLRQQEREYVHEAFYLGATRDQINSVAGSITVF